MKRAPIRLAPCRVVFETPRHTPSASCSEGRLVGTKASSPALQPGPGAIPFAQRGHGAAAHLGNTFAVPTSQLVRPEPNQRSLVLVAVVGGLRPG